MISSQKQKNYRTSGKRRVGKILTGNAQHYASVPTIPTKFVTVLNPDYHEKKGFLQQAPRFKPEPVLLLINS
jgi:hypothetical protein